MKIFYRGYVIDEEIRSISYSVYGRRPERPELTAKGSSREAMEWIDVNVNCEANPETARTLPPAVYQMV